MTKKKIQIYWPGITLMLSLAILAVPATIMYNIAIETQGIAGTPVFGDRFNNDLNPKISKGQVNELDDTIRDIEGIVELEVNLRSATLRINVLTSLEISDDQINALITKVKDAVFGKLPESEYFTASLERKQYDFEIHLRNTKDRLDENYRYIIVSKTSLMTTFIIQEVSTPKNPEFVAELNAALNPPTEGDND
ncbi:MAG: hypothetical protein KGZ84_09025 [Erysipelotrichia bacterium]|jgi:hypothetical protein|nr:hypothetical protein [Erysipelotrichia bacterium]